MTALNIAGWDILIVDDEPDNLTFLEVLLDFFDAKVTTANSGGQARDLLLGHSYQLGLLDLQMPKVSGWDLVREVRTSPDAAIRATPLIAVTALAMPSDRERVLAAGFDGYITKPVEVATFMQTVEGILENLTARQLHSSVEASIASPELPPTAEQSAAISDLPELPSTESSSEPPVEVSTKTLIQIPIERPSEPSMPTVTPAAASIRPSDNTDQPPPETDSNSSHGSLQDSAPRAVIGQLGMSAQSQAYQASASQGVVRI